MGLGIDDVLRADQGIEDIAPIQMEHHLTDSFEARGGDEAEREDPFIAPQKFPRAGNGRHFGGDDPVKPLALVAHERRGVDAVHGLGPQTLTKPLRHLFAAAALEKVLLTLRKSDAEGREAFHPCALMERFGIHQDAVEVEDQCFGFFHDYFRLSTIVTANARRNLSYHSPPTASRLNSQRFEAPKVLYQTILIQEQSCLVRRRRHDVPITLEVCMRLRASFRFLLCVFVMPSWVPAEGLDGRWQGIAEKTGEIRELNLEIRREGGTPSALLTMPCIGRMEYPAARTEINGAALRAEFGDPKKPIVIEAQARSSVLAGTMRYGDFIAELRLAPAPAGPPYSREQVTFQNGRIKLAGELFLPASGAPLPAIIHMHGSGDNPRWVYYFFADFFARRGIACLVFDKRGNGGSSGNWREGGFWDLAEDGVAAAQFLKSRKEIDAKRIGMFGISQAGWIMPMASSRSRDIAFIIAVSGGPITFEREGRWDVEYWFSKKGYSQADIEEAIEYLKLDAQITRSGEGYDKLREMYRQIRTRPWYKDAPSRFAVPIPPNARTREFDRRSIDIDHVSIVKSLEIPALWIYGEDDESMPGPETAALVRKIKEENQKEFTVLTFPKADHGIRVPVPADSLFPFRTHAPGYLEAIAGWVSAEVLQASSTPSN